MTETSTINIISKQSGIDDLLHVERVYYECDGDMIKTILKLMEQPYVMTKEELKPKTIFDDIRSICDEKDTVFQDFLEKNKST
jgi:hypothetical protein